MLSDDYKSVPLKEVEGGVTLAILLALAVLIVILRMHTIMEPLTMDTAVYGYISHALLVGEELYTGVWDHKPPGVFLLFMLSELIFGYGPKSIAYTGIFFTLVSLLFIFLFTREVAGNFAALIASAFWALASNSVFLQANENNVEVFLNTFTLIALWAFIKSRGSSSKRYLLITGASFALASLLKTIALFPLLAVAVFALFFAADEVRGRLDGKKRVRTIVYLFGPGAIVWALVFIYFALVGRFPDFWQSVFVFNSNYSGSIFTNVWTFIANPVLVFHEAYKDIWFLVLSALAWIVFSRKEYGEPRLARGFFILIFIGVLVELASPGRYFRHYYQLMIPVISILGALFFFDLRSRFSVKENSKGKAVFVVLIILTFINLTYYQASYLYKSPDEISMIKHGSGAIDIREMAKYVEAHTAPCEKIYVWGGEAGIYFYAKRRAASGIFFIFPIYFDSEEGRAAKLKRIYTDITNDPPALFIRSKGYGTFDADSLFAFVKERYRLVKSFIDVDIYELKGRLKKTECVGAQAL